MAAINNKQEGHKQRHDDIQPPSDEFNVKICREITTTDLPYKYIP